MFIKFLARNRHHVVREPISCKLIAAKFLGVNIWLGEPHTVRVRFPKHVRASTFPRSPLSINYSLKDEAGFFSQTLNFSSNQITKRYSSSIRLAQNDKIPPFCGGHLCHKMAQIWTNWAIWTNHAGETDLLATLLVKTLPRIDEKPTAFLRVQCDVHC